MRLVFFPILIFLSLASLSAQNVVGMKSGEIKAYFKANYPDLSLEPNITNDHYRYLKYTDVNDNKLTVLAFLNEKERCSAVRYIYDLSMEKEVLEELDSRFDKAGTNKWKDAGKRGGVVIIYKKEEWFITVNYKQE